VIFLDGHNLVQPTDSGGNVRLALFESVQPWPDQQDPTIRPLMPMISQTPPVDPAGGRSATLIGNGPGVGPNPIAIFVSCYGSGTCAAWNWVGETQKTWGHAAVTAPTYGVFVNTFFDFYSQTDTANGAIGDSGRGVFVKVNGSWMLAGIMQEIGGCDAIQSVSVQGCQSTSSWDLSVFGSQILPYLPVDTDGDGVPDAVDNCPALSTPIRRTAGASA
jgi:hypothetical protein